MKEYLEARVAYLRRVLKENRALLKKHFTESLASYILQIRRDLVASERALKAI